MSRRESGSRSGSSRDSLPAATPIASRRESGSRSGSSRDSLPAATPIASRRRAGAKSIVGVISDTHGILRPQAVAALAGVDAIVHAGDIGAPEVLTELARIAPVTAVRGNNDRERWASRIPETATLDVAGARLYVIHDRHALTIDPHAAGVSAVISGHSHRPAIEERDGVLFVNPGSAGPRRFTLPVATARLRVAQGAVSGEIVLLDV